MFLINACWENSRNGNVVGSMLWLMLQRWNHFWPAAFHINFHIISKVVLRAYGLQIALGEEVKSGSWTDVLAKVLTSCNSQISSVAWQIFECGLVGKFFNRIPFLFWKQFLGTRIGTVGLNSLENFAMISAEPALLSCDNPVHTALPIPEVSVVKEIMRVKLVHGQWNCVSHEMNVWIILNVIIIWK